MIDRKPDFEIQIAAATLQLSLNIARNCEAFISASEHSIAHSGHLPLSLRGEIGYHGPEVWQQDNNF